jgi:cation:H+ antiporter
MAGYLVALIAGLVLLLLSADRFVEGAVTVARYGRMPPLVIGMVVVGFGTSLPEMLVSVLASAQGSGGIALGNAYGSNIVNIGLILGISALIKPLRVQSGVLKKELPLLMLVTGISIPLLLDMFLARWEALVLLALFAVFLYWTLRQGFTHPQDALAEETAVETGAGTNSLRQGIFWLVAGLLVLVASSRLLVWSATVIARQMGLSEMIIGLTVVAMGTSLPEFASSVAAARKGEHDIALGNVIGSNMFNTLAVIGLSGIIRPIGAEAGFLGRDMLVMGFLTLSLFLFGYGFGGRQGRINRFEGLLLVGVYAGYLAWLIVPLVA